MTIERLAEAANADALARRWGRAMTGTFMVEVGVEQWLVEVREGVVERVRKGPFTMPGWRFAIRAPREAWDKFWQPLPEPGWHDLFGLLRRGDARIEGDVRFAMAHMLFLKLMLSAPRRAA